MSVFPTYVCPEASRHVVLVKDMERCPFCGRRLDEHRVFEADATQPKAGDE